MLFFRNPHIPSERLNFTTATSVRLTQVEPVAIAVMLPGFDAPFHLEGPLAAQLWAAVESATAAGEAVGVGTGDGAALEGDEGTGGRLP